MSELSKYSEKIKKGDCKYTEDEVELRLPIYYKLFDKCKSVGLNPKIQEIFDNFIKCKELQVLQKLDEESAEGERMRLQENLEEKLEKGNITPYELEHESSMERLKISQRILNKYKTLYRALGFDVEEFLNEKLINGKTSEEIDEMLSSGVFNGTGEVKLRSDLETRLIKCFSDENSKPPIDVKDDKDNNDFIECILYNRRDSSCQKKVYEVKKI